MTALCRQTAHIHTRSLTIQGSRMKTYYGVPVTCTIPTPHLATFGTVFTDRFLSADLSTTNLSESWDTIKDLNMYV